MSNEIAGGVGILIDAQKHVASRDEFSKNCEEFLSLSIGEIAHRLADIKQIKKELEERISNLNKRFAAGETILRDEMVEAEVGTTFEDAEIKLVLKSEEYGTVENPAALAASLIGTPDEAIGKVLIAPDALTDEIREIVKLGLDPSIEYKIHPSTWGAFVRSQVGSGKIDPLDKATWPPGVEIKTRFYVSIKTK